MKKVLILTYHFPTQTAVSAQRVAKTIKFLPEFGWTPIVFTTDEENGTKSDHNSHWDGGIKMVRVASFFSKQKSAQVKDDNKLSYPWENNSRPRNLKRKILTWLRNYFLIPDGRILWCSAALLPLIRIIKSEQPNALLVTGPPFSAFVLARLARFITGIPIVLDYRDPWTLCFHGFRRAEPSLRKKIELGLEKRIISASGLVTGTTQQILDYCKTLDDREIRTSRYVQVLNGFDHDDFERIQPEHFSELAIVYTGKIESGLYDLMPFLRGLTLFLSRNPYLASAFKIIFAGSFTQVEAIRYIENHGLSHMIELRGFQSHATCVAMQKGADLLLMIGNHGYLDKWVIASKIFEYIAAQKPIMAIVPKECPTAELITANGWGSVADPLEIEEIARILQKHVMPGETNGRRNNDDISKFSRRSQTRLLAEAMDKLTQMKTVGPKRWRQAEVASAGSPGHAAPR